MKVKVTLLVLCFFLFLAGVKPVFAADPHLFLSPTTGNYSSGFIVEVKVDSGGKAAGGVDVYLEFPKNLLKIESTTKGTDFPEVYSLIKNDEGKLRFNAYFPISQAGESYIGSNGLIAKINFTPLGTGTAAVKFLCTSGATNDSNIVEKATVKDIIICSANVNGSYILSGEAPPPGPTATPTPTPIPGRPTATPTVPVSGLINQTVSLVGLGILTVLTGLVLVF